MKGALNLLARVLIAPAAACCWLEARAGGGDGAFLFWGQVMALIPGLPGVFLRRAFYRSVLAGCADDVTIGFGTLVSRRGARFDRGVYIGPYALIGWAWIQEKSLIGSRASLLSGGNQHQPLPNGEWSPTDPATLERIVIGRNTWVGEGAILMAGTGEGTMIAAGAVVASPVPGGVKVGGNPARFVSKVVPVETVGA